MYPYNTLFSIIHYYDNIISLISIIVIIAIFSVCQVRMVCKKIA